MEEFVQLLQTFGVPTAALVWIAFYILRPMADRHLKLVDTISETQVRLTDALERIAEQCPGQSNGVPVRAYRHSPPSAREAQ